MQIWKLGHRLVFVIENSDKVTHGDSKDGGVLSLLNSPTAQLLEMILACCLPPDRHEKPNIITENQNLYSLMVQFYPICLTVRLLWGPPHKGRNRAATQNKQPTFARAKNCFA